MAQAAWQLLIALGCLSPEAGQASLEPIPGLFLGPCPREQRWDSCYLRWHVTGIEFKELSVIIPISKTMKGWHMVA